MSTGLFIIAHAPLASALKSVAAHAYPESIGVLDVLDVTPGMTPEQIEAQAAALLRKAGHEHVLILADVFGATPCNAAQRLADGQRIKVVAGVNVPMLWRVLCYVSEPIDALVSRALSGATQGVMQLSTARPQNQARGATVDDPLHHHHQQ
jgi:PTS system ascorbate-specific IIA component